MKRLLLIAVLLTSCGMEEDGQYDAKRVKECQEITGKTEKECKGKQPARSLFVSAPEDQEWSGAIQDGATTSSVEGIGPMEIPLPDTKVGAARNFGIVVQKSNEGLWLIEVHCFTYGDLRDTASTDAEYGLALVSCGR